jgi:hypothetical protein
MPDAPGDLTISVQLHAKDVRRATIMYLLNWPLLTLLAIVVCGTAYISIASDDLSQAYITALVVLFVFVLLPWIQAAVSMRNPMMQSPICHTFSASGITSTFQGGHIGLEWQLVKKARETGRYISIWGKQGVPMLVPKSPRRG